MILRITKTLLGITTFLVISTSVYAQPLSHYGQRIFFGVKGGVNLSTFEGEFDIPEFVSSDFKYTNRLTGYGGLLLNYYIGNGIAFQGEVNYSMMGAKAENNRQNIDLYAVNFLEIPAIIRYHAGQPKRPQFYIEAGPVMHIALFARDHLDRFDLQRKTKENYRGASYGVTGGMGMQFYAKKYRVLVGGRYTLGFTDINEFERTVNKLRTFSFGVTVMKDIFYYY